MYPYIRAKEHITKLCLTFLVAGAGGGYLGAKYGDDIQDAVHDAVSGDTTYKIVISKEQKQSLAEGNALPLCDIFAEMLFMGPMDDLFLEGKIAGVGVYGKDGYCMTDYSKRHSETQSNIHVPTGRTWMPAWREETRKP